MLIHNRQRQSGTQSIPPWSMSDDLFISIPSTMSAYKHTSSGSISTPQLRTLDMLRVKYSLYSRSHIMLCISTADLTADRQAIKGPAGSLPHVSWFVSVSIYTGMHQQRISCSTYNVVELGLVDPLERNVHFPELSLSNTGQRLLNSMSIQCLWDDR